MVLEKMPLGEETGGRYEQVWGPGSLFFSGFHLFGGGKPKGDYNKFGRRKKTPPHPSRISTHVLE